MRPFPCVSAACACVITLSAAAAAQSRSEPNLVLTILGGAVTGHDLWTVERQPLCVGGTCSGQYDTLRLSRSINSSIVLGAAGTYFVSPHVGIHAEISYVGFPTESGCRGVFFNPDAARQNEQICEDIESQAGKGGAMAIFGGATVRGLSRNWLSPYARGSVGLVIQSHSMIEVVGGFVDGSGAFSERRVIADSTPHRVSPMLSFAAGFTTPLGNGYQFRLEARNVVSRFDRLIGSANSLGHGPTARRYYNHFALTLGFDVVLEKRRGRRY